jgi:hypothetical protein
MFKKYRILLILVIFFSCEFNQKLVSQETEIVFGVKAGANMSTLNGEQSYLTYQEINKIDPTSKLGLMAGPLVIYKLSKEYGIQTEFLFSMKGVNFDLEEYIQTWSLWYIEIPVLFKSTFEMKDNINGAFLIGPSLGYLIKKTWSDKFNGNFLHENTELLGINNLDFSLVLGAGGDMKALSGRLGLDLRYSYGLMSLQNNVSVQNGTISLCIYYLFSEDKKLYED